MLRVVSPEGVQMAAAGAHALCPGGCALTVHIPPDTPLEGTWRVRLTQARIVTGLGWNRLFEWPMLGWCVANYPWPWVETPGQATLHLWMGGGSMTAPATCAPGQTIAWEVTYETRAVTWSCETGA